MRVIAKTGLVYIPEWNDNKKETDKIQIHYRYLTGPEYDRFIGIGPVQFDEDGNQVGGFEFRLDKEGMVRAGIEKIDNLIVEDGKIETGAALCECPEVAGLYREFIEFYMEANREPDKKKLK